MHTVETFVPDQLIASNANLLVSRPITLAAGDALPRGAVLGQVTLSGHYVLSAADDGDEPPVAIADGSEVPDAVLVEAAPASAGTRQALAYVRGDFQSAHVTLGSGHTVASVREGLRLKGIFLI